MATPMKPSGALRPKPADALVALAILLAALVLAFSAWDRQTGALSAVLSADGQVVETVALSKLSGAEQRTITAGGYTLRLLLSAGGVTVESSDCPNQDCVHTGHISRPGQSVVCLPARVSVMLTGAEEGGVDAVLG